MTDTNKTGNDLASLVQREVTGHPGYPEFAAWCEIQLIHPYPIYFMIWQASREAVVVELPSEIGAPPYACFQSGWNDMRGEAVDAIEAGPEGGVMTIDKAKLKSLAEAATQGEWSHERFGMIQAGPVIQFANGAGRQQIAMATGADWMVQGEQIANAEFMASANPSVVLALLAEIERHEAWRTAFLAERDAQMRQRDQLRAENEDYRSGQVRYEQIIDDLKAENEALRKALGKISVQVDGNIRCAVRDVVNGLPDVQDIYGYCDNIDEIIEAAMAKEADHD
jgi:hypothetical protein